MIILQNKTHTFPCWNKFPWLNNKTALACLFDRLENSSEKLRFKKINIPLMFLLFFPQQLLSEHRVFSPREAAVQVGGVNSFSPGWLFRGHEHKTTEVWGKLSSFSIWQGKNQPLTWHPHTLGLVSWAKTVADVGSYRWIRIFCLAVYICEFFVCFILFC